MMVGVDGTMSWVRFSQVVQACPMVNGSWSGFRILSSHWCGIKGFVASIEPCREAVVNTCKAGIF